MDDLQFFNPYEDIRFTANRLPHWQQKGAVYWTHRRCLTARLFRSPSSQCEALGKLHSLHQTQSQKSRLREREFALYESELAKGIQ